MGGVGALNWTVTGCGLGQDGAAVARPGDEALYQWSAIYADAGKDK